MVKIQAESVLIIVMILLIGVSGCMVDDNKNNRKKTPEEIVLSYMEERYGEEFVITNMGSVSWTGRGQTNYILQTKDGFPGNKYEDAYIVAEFSKLDNKVMRDSYLDFLMREDIEAFISELAEGIYQNYRVLYFPSSNRVNYAGMNKGMTAKEYLRRMVTTNWILCVGDSHNEVERDEAIEQLRVNFAENEISANFYVFYIPTAQVKSVYNIDEKELLRADWVYAYANLTMSSENYQFKRIEWRGSNE